MMNSFTFIYSVFFLVVFFTWMVCQEELQKEQKANEDDLLEFQYLYVPRFLNAYMYHQPIYM